MKTRTLHDELGRGTLGQTGFRDALSYSRPYVVVDSVIIVLDHHVDGSKNITNLACQKRILQS